MKYLSGAEEEEAIKWMEEAAKIAQSALCLRAKCGTVIVSDGNIIGKGYNAPPLDDLKNALCDTERGERGKHDRTCCMHAEWRAILDGVKRNPNRMVGSQLYFTRVNENGEILKSGEPYCSVCSRLALDAGVSEFVLWHEKGICSYDTTEYNKLSFR
jgi:deoxycytidylate deaminase